MMLINLFSVFDPCSYFGLSLNWLIIILVIICFPLKYYLVGSGNQGVFILIVRGVDKMFCEIAAGNYLGIVFVGVVTFIYLVLINLIGLFPFIFTRTAHPFITIGFGVVFWCSFFLLGALKNFKNRAAHLVPEGSPLFLSPFIVIIERISHLIRPFTLSIRLAANIIAGHLIVRLLSRIRLLGLFGFTISLLLQRILLLLEIGVCIIQGFVFRILVLLYCLEYY